MRYVSSFGCYVTRASGLADTDDAGPWHDVAPVCGAGLDHSGVGGTADQEVGRLLELRKPRAQIRSGVVLPCDQCAWTDLLDLAPDHLGHMLPEVLLDSYQNPDSPHRKPPSFLFAKIRTLVYNVVR